MWEPVAQLQARAAELLPALLLARFDGTSPVEYVTADADRAMVRAFADERLAANGSMGSLLDTFVDWQNAFAAR